MKLKHAKSKTSHYYNWLGRNRKNANKAQEQKQKFMEELREISGM
jgi:hypothetical protein